MEERLNDFVPSETIIKYLKLENKKLERTIRSLSIKLGQELSYSQELEFELNKLKKASIENKGIDEEARKEVRKEDLYNMLKKQISGLIAEKKKIKSSKDDLIKKIYDYEQILKEHNLL